MPYAIKVPLLGVDQEWVYVTQKHDKRFDIATYQTYVDAQNAAKIWKNAKVVDYVPPNGDQR